MPQGTRKDSRTDEEIGSALDLPMRSLDLLLKSLVDEAQANASDEMTATRIVEQILQAETVDDVLSGGVVKVEELNYDAKGFSSHIELLGGTSEHPELTIQPSSFGGKGLHYYCVCPCKIDGEKTVFVTSAANICAQLVKLLQLNAYPRVVQVRQSHSRPREDAPAGYDVYRLVKPRNS